MIDLRCVDIDHRLLNNFESLIVDRSKLGKSLKSHGKTRLQENFASQ